MGVWVVSVWVVSVSPIVSKASEADVLEAVLVLRWMYFFSVEDSVIGQCTKSISKGRFRQGKRVTS